MESEKLAIFNENLVKIGTRSRAKVHTQGYWHQTFHCWFLQAQDDKQYLLFQRRAPQKDQFPNLLDITVAGHLLNKEKPGDGVREIQEELGLQINESELIPGGVIKDQYISHHFKNREFCNVYYYHLQQDIATLTLQEDEVAGISQLEIADCLRLFRGETEMIEGIEYQAPGGDQPLQAQIRQYQLRDFCPHNAHYYARVLFEAEQFAQKHMDTHTHSANDIAQHTF